MTELIAIAGVCLTGAAMTVTVLVLGAREELIPARSPMFMRIPALMLASLVLGSIVTAMAVTLDCSTMVIRTFFLGTFASCLGELLFLSVFLLRVPVFITVLNGRYWRIANTRHLWTFGSILLVVSLGAFCWGATAMLPPAIFSCFLLLGWFVSLVLMEPYLRYGFDGYEEVFSAGDFYVRMTQACHELTRVRIAAQTPGLILPSEDDPEKWPLPGRHKYPGRPRLFEAYRRAAASGLQMDFLVSEAPLVKEIKAYIDFGQTSYIDEAFSRVKDFMRPESKIKFRILVGAECALMAPGSELHQCIVIGDTNDNRGLLVKAARGAHAKVRHAEIIRCARYSKKMRVAFDDAWERARPLTVEELSGALNRNGVGAANETDRCV